MLGLRRGLRSLATGRREAARREAEEEEVVVVVEAEEPAEAGSEAAEG